uniref:Uncharacterized protein n=1 Tax=Oryza punctata TaxID=4537 RepID=A0A0E0KBK6_ORYPU
MWRGWPKRLATTTTPSQAAAEEDAEGLI